MILILTVSFIVGYLILFWAKDDKPPRLERNWVDKMEDSKLNDLTGPFDGPRFS